MQLASKKDPRSEEKAEEEEEEEEEEEGQAKGGEVDKGRKKNRKGRGMERKRRGRSEAGDFRGITITSIIGCS